MPREIAVRMMSRPRGFVKHFVAIEMGATSVRETRAGSPGKSKKARVALGLAPVGLLASGR